MTKKADQRAKPRELSAERLADLRRLCEKATPGKWTWTGKRAKRLVSEPTGEPSAGPESRVLSAAPVAWGEASYVQVSDADAEFIATARDVMLELLDEVDRLRAELADAEGAGHGAVVS